jgi:hypothetical protein
MLRILIGGSGSTGSSLLKNILSRHSEIFAGSETALFTKKALYDDFQRHKSRILKRFPEGLRSHSYHMYNGVDLMEEEYGFTKKTLRSAIQKSQDFQTFTDLFFGVGISRYGKKHWLEKTPANAYLFREFLATFENSKVVHITRNPIDTIYSLIKRGFNLLEACGIYLLNTAAALRSQEEDHYYQIKYESILNDPEHSLTDLLCFLGLDYEPEVLVSGNPYGIKDTKITSWKYDETSEIRENTTEIPETIKENIQKAIGMVVVSREGKKLYDVVEMDFQSVLAKIGYDHNYLPPDDATLKLLKRLLREDRWNRMKKFYQTGFYYPVKIRIK